MQCARAGGCELGGRQHLLRWWPGTWADWEACGLAYDSTVGFSDLPGFRAGTCHPYRPWLIEENREADLLEIPLVLMEGTLFDYMRLPLNECLEAFDRLLRRCEAVGGVFTLLWHNSTSVDRRLAPLLPRLLDRLANTPNYDWRDDLIRLRQPRPW